MVTCRILSSLRYCGEKICKVNSKRIYNSNSPLGPSADFFSLSSPTSVLPLLLLMQVGHVVSAVKSCALKLENSLQQCVSMREWCTNPHKHQFFYVAGCGMFTGYLSFCTCIHLSQSREFGVSGMLRGKFISPGIIILLYPKHFHYNWFDKGRCNSFYLVKFTCQQILKKKSLSR